MASNLPPLSASVTRILSLTGFPPELKTKDIQDAFSEWDNVLGGFKIKWVNDTSLLLVFADANVAKRAYLQTLLSPHPSLVSPTSALSLQIKPYDGPDAQQVIMTVNSRRNNNSRSSISVPHNGRSLSISGPAGLNGPLGGVGLIPNAPRPAVPSNSWKNPNPNPNIPIGGGGLASSMHAPTSNDYSPPHRNTIPVEHLPEESSPLGVVTSSGSAPRVGDPARRMVGAALGMKHPGVSPRASPAPNTEVLGKAMGGLVIAE